MAITFNCAQCGKSYTLDDSLAGKQAKCSCGTQMTVPAPSPAPAVPSPPPAAPMPAAPMPGQPMPGQFPPAAPMQGQPMQGQPMQGQPMQGQPMQGQFPPAAPMPGQPMQGSPYASPGYAPQGNAPQGVGTADAARVEALFKWYWIHLLWGFLTLCIAVGYVGIIAAVVYQYMLIYKLWSLIPRERAQTTPGKAVGFMFIPFFNCYWVFVAVHGLAKALNNEIRSVAPNKEVSEGLSLAFCICLFVFPFACPVLIIILLKQLTTAGAALANSRGH